MTATAKRGKWEYKLYFGEVGYSLTGELNALGKEGWEAVGYTKEDHVVTVLLKRRER